LSSLLLRYDTIHDVWYRNIPKEIGMLMDRDLIDRLRRLAETSPVPLADLSMEDLAAALGMTRMTLYRKAGPRARIVDALEAAGIDARRQPDVHDRVVEAAAALLRREALASVTLDAIATEAGCSLAALYARFGNREGVIKAVIERYSPLIPVREAFVVAMQAETVDLRRDIRLLYGMVLPRVLEEWPMLRSLVGEVIRNTGSDVNHAFREWYLPQITAVLVPLFSRHIAHGTVQPLPMPVLVQTLIGPVALHGVTREIVTGELGIELPDLDATIDIFTDIFCRAVGVPPLPSPPSDGN
jgi:AcrR family transcriptional regulator